ncbi:hypothetical protein [Mycoplasmopsis agalactiae]|nr:hypothetical protein [Mycoplasmopsis agalactiae]MCE6057108.1 hypothetical protein [Mycoplasmopsis agalactiae]MCE6078895.1 hypothetical protein [Mycoplasmopsis agalactiae]MCE6095280.1 hypothetical protein [Mycoplasmopsis agalactiae]MCE6114535.1 hypothetical protein [Mycoplasmopsis agalactiae]
MNAKGTEKLKHLIFNIFTKTNIMFNVSENNKIKNGAKTFHKVLVILTLPNSGTDSIHIIDSGIIMNIVINKTVISGI